MVRNIHASGSWLIKDQSSTPHVIILPRISHSRFYATDKLYPLGIIIIAYIRNLIQVFRHFFQEKKKKKSVDIKITKKQPKRKTI